MPRIITDEAALAALVDEYNRRKAWQTGGLQLAWIEKALDDVPDASLLGFDVRDLMPLALAMRKHGFTPEELHDIAGNMQAAFDLICGLLSRQTQDVINEALSHLPFTEERAAESAQNVPEA